jgi:hypothetical protein
MCSEAPSRGLGVFYKSVNYVSNPDLDITLDK